MDFRRRLLFQKIQRFGLRDKPAGSKYFSKKYLLFAQETLNILLRDLSSILSSICHMGMTKKMEAENIRKITKTAGGDSYSITLPIELVRRLGWKERQKVKVALQGRTILIRDWKR